MVAKGIDRLRLQLSRRAMPSRWMPSSPATGAAVGRGRKGGDLFGRLWPVPVGLGLGLGRTKQDANPKPLSFRTLPHRHGNLFGFSPVAECRRAGVAYEPNRYYMSISV